MIAKCIAVLAVVAQINASGCNCGVSSVAVPTTGPSALSSPAVFVSSPNSGFGDSSAVTRNLVGSGKYPVALSDCGSIAERQVPVTTSHVTAPLQERPTVRLPASIPAPRVISHSCTCYQTVLRPRVHQQIITVPSIERYIETIQKPVIENIQYEALPVGCGSSSGSGVQFVQVGSGVSRPLEILSLGSGAQIQAVEIPSVQFPQFQAVQAIQAPQVQAVQAIQAPQVQAVPIIPQASFGTCQC